MQNYHQEDIAALLLAVGRDFDRKEHRKNAHQEHLAEVFLRVVAELDKENGKTIHSLEAFVRSVGAEEFRRASWRERKQAQRHTPTADDTALECGVAHGARRAPLSYASPLDELIVKEESAVLATFLARLPEAEAQLVRTLPRGSSTHSLNDIAQQSGTSVRTIQRRRGRLVASFRAEVAG
ncbi:hypothetical protein R5W23_003666 [Gemmata sp. JC673]|uniref:Sigma-70 family RNA polymerase sigma factor n=1 Tax=Gemmata algarum TaxID=2975278 RepID=A0ABU5F4F0_9BACT|nr:hypothetical protein [Gemmata algarum]MDY3562205.1 hypothetical protein [Gemmata algarum]